jgi:UDP-glucose 4-epimerase
MDLAITNNNWQITALRYFNPIGAHESGTIGEDPSDIPNNLMPYVSQVAVGKLKELSVFGNDYPTPDGTGVRDYIHVTDLAKAHVAALDIPATPNEYRAINVGTGKGTSVLELVNAFEHASGVKIPYKITDRRPGDIAACYADPSLAHSLLGWQAQKSLKDACADSWRWQSGNPNGYKG